MATFDEFFSSLDLDENGILKKNKTAKDLPFEKFVKCFITFTLKTVFWEKLLYFESISN